MQGVIALARSAISSNDPTQAKSTSKVGTSGVALKSSPGRLYALDITNHGTSAFVLMIFDKASAPTNGDAPIWRRIIPAGGEITLDFGMFGLGCANGIAFAISQSIASDTLTLPATSDCHYGALYK